MDSIQRKAFEQGCDTHSTPRHFAIDNMFWMKLPAEIRLQVISNLDHESLKSFRLVGKDGMQASTSKLFSVIHLTPNTRSFDRAHQVANCRQLAHYVKEVVLHIGVLEDVHNGFQAFRDDMMRLHRPVGSTYEITESILWKYNCFLEEIEGQRRFMEERDEVDELMSLCQSFEELDSISMLLDEDDPFKPPTDFVGRRTGSHSSVSAIGDHFSSLLSAVAGKSLTKIDCSSASWSCFSLVDHETLSSIDLTRLRQLSLSLYNSEYQDLMYDERSSALTAFSAFLQSSLTPMMRYLHLDLDELPLGDGSSSLVELSSIVFYNHWPCLATLDLMGIVAKEDDLVDFLGKHSSTLRHLHLDDIEIVEKLRSRASESDEDTLDDQTTGSVINLFHRISRILNLDSAAISGNFTNGENESWYVNVDIMDKDCLRNRIENWLCRKGPSPLPKELCVEVIASNIQTHYVHDRPSPTFNFYGKEIQLELKDFSDESWQWTPF